MKTDREILNDVALALRERRITQDAFLRETAAIWRRKAKWLWSRRQRRLPAWVEIDDLVVELQMLALKHVETWDPERAKRASIGSYVMWCTVKRAQRKMDEWRGASTTGNSGKNPSRYEVAFSRAGGGEQEEGGDLGTRVPDEFRDPVERLESGEEFEAMLRRTQTVRQALVMLAMRACDGAVDKAADALWRNFRSRTECGIRSPKHARTIVLEAIEQLESFCPEPEKSGVLPTIDFFQDIETGAA